jgi:hypothetical protein
MASHGLLEDDKKRNDEFDYYNCCETNDVMLPKKEIDERHLVVVMFFLNFFHSK